MAQPAARPDGKWTRHLGGAGTEGPAQREPGALRSPVVPLTHRPASAAVLVVAARGLVEDPQEALVAAATP